MWHIKGNFLKTNVTERIEAEVGHSFQSIVIMLSDVIIKFAVGLRNFNTESPFLNLKEDFNGNGNI